MHVLHERPPLFIFVPPRIFWIQIDQDDVSQGFEYFLFHIALGLKR